MLIDLELVPTRKRAAGERCCEPVAFPDVARDHALRMAEISRALGDPIRLELLDVLRKHAGKVCVCELVPLFEASQPTLSHHLRKLRDAGIVDSERQGLWRRGEHRSDGPLQGRGGPRCVQEPVTQRAPRERETPRRTVLTEVRRLAARNGASSQRALVRGTVR